MILQFDNRALRDISTEMAHLEALIASGSNKVLTLDDNNGLSQNNFIIIGDLFLPKSEIAKINAAVTAGTSVQVDTLIFPHNPRDVVRQTPYDKVKLYSASTISGTKTLVDTKDIDVDQQYTDFEVADSATGYYFFTLYNSYSTDESSYSSAIEVESTSNKTLSEIRRLIEVFYDDTISNQKLQAVIDSVIDFIYAYYPWKFREATVSFTTTTGTYEYDIESDMGIRDWGTLVSARTSTQIMNVITSDQDDMLSLNPLTLIPHTIFEWSGKLYIRTPTGEAVTIKYLKNTESLINSGTKTGVSLASCIAFGVLELLYLPKDRALSQDFGKKYALSMKAMLKNENKSVDIFTLGSIKVQKSEFDTTPKIT